MEQLMSEPEVAHGTFEAETVGVVAEIEFQIVAATAESGLA